jgi:hypothetical protein
MRPLPMVLLVAVPGMIALTLLVSGSAAHGSEDAATGASIEIELEPRQLGVTLHVGAVGLSMETKELGSGRLDAENSSLVRLMRLLGPSLLRVGGNTVDSSWWTRTGEVAPTWATNTVTPTDLSALLDLLRATGWHALLSVDLGHFEPQRAANESRTAQEILGPALAGIEIGNEPDDFAGPEQRLRSRDYGSQSYLDEVGAYAAALHAAVPGLKLYGPSLSGVGWLPEIGAAAQMFSTLTQHFYPISDCKGDRAAHGFVEPTAGALLSASVRSSESAVLAALAQEETLAGPRPALIDETNGFACGGTASAGPSFSSALWALDWALRATSSGVAGLNFHGGPECGPTSQSPICDSPRGTAIAQPEFYGLLAARKLEGGRFLPVVMRSRGSQPTLTAWATETPSGTVTLAIDDLGSSGQAEALSILAPGFATGVEQTLSGPSVASTAGIDLGGASIGAAGRWHPKHSRLRRDGSSFVTTIRPASAAIIRLEPS